MMSKPKLTVITPVYNSAKYIERFMKNFNRANVDNIAELIFIDDGSTDKSLKLLKQIKEKQNNIKLLTQNHHFQSAARNLGMSQASGKYYMFLDVDDTFSDNFFSIMVKKIEQSDLVICGIKRSLQNNTLILNNSVLEGAKTKHDLAQKFLLERDQMDSGLWNKIFKANIINTNNLKFSNKNFVEDILFVFKYLMCINPQNIVYYHHPLYTYYQNSETTTTSYYPELDILADSYIKQVTETLIQHKITNQNELTVNTVIRTQVYVVHRHILGDPNWDAKKQKEFLNQLLKQVKNSQKLLPIKYKIGIVFMKLLPTIYIKIYRQYKRIH